MNKAIPQCLRGAVLFGLAACLLISPAVKIAAQEAPPDEVLSSQYAKDEGFETYAENSSLELLVDRGSAEFAVRNKASSMVWYSNPPGREENPEITGEEIPRSHSLAVVNLIDKMDRKTQYTVYGDCLSENQYTVEKIDNGVRFLFDLGLEKITAEDLPSKINMEKFNERILAALDSSDKVKIKKIYKVSQMENCMVLSTNKTQDFEYVYALFQEIGYTEEDIAADNAEFHITSQGKKIRFRLEITCELDGSSLVVRVPTDRFFDSEDYAVESISLLEYFGAPEAGEEGYILVPDGTGYLVELTGDLAGQTPYNTAVYGEDPNSLSTEQTFESDGLALPLYGIKRGDDAVVVQVENGAALTRLTVEPPGYTPYFNAYFQLCPHKYEKNRVEENNMLLFSESNFSEEYVLRYEFLAGEGVSYADMARTVQARLFPAGSSGEAPANYGFSLDVICSIEKLKSIAGFPVYCDTVTTSFGEVRTMAQELTQAGITDMNMVIGGWLEDGLSHPNLAKSADTSSALGGAKAFSRLLQDLEGMGVTGFADMNLFVVNDVPTGLTGLFYGKGRYLAQDILGRNSPHYPLRYDTLEAEEIYPPYYYLNPAALPQCGATIRRLSEKNGLKNLSFNDAASTVYSSGRRGRDFIDRDAQTKDTAGFLKGWKDEDYQLAARKGNAYALPYLDMVTDLSSRGSANSLFTQSVPFIPLVLNGHMRYAYEPYNLSSDREKLRLTIAETGADLYFELIYREQEIFKDTQYNTLYSTEYGLYRDTAVSLYEELNSRLAPVKKARLVDHRLLTPDVRESIYDNGCRVLVNYGDTAYTLDGTVVPAGDYCLLEGGVHG